MKSNPKFAKLLGPAQSGQLELKNRMVLAAMGLNYASEDGYISEREKEFYGERARGGVGTIILGVGCVDLVGKLMTHQICIYDDKFIPGLTEMAETIQRHGAKALIQLQHGGRYSRPERNGGHQPVAPSPILMPGVVPGREQPGELTVEEIAQLAERFAEAAEQAKRVVVVGGGPAGMEAARMAALKGHQVTLYEKGRRLGGSLQYASVLSRENEQLLTYLVAQTKKLPVEIKLGEEVAPGLIEGMNPDATILAVGPNLVPPQIPGADRRDVLSGAELRQVMVGHLEKGTAGKLGWRRRLALRLAGPILRNLKKPTMLRRLAGLWMPLGKKVAIIGGDFVTCELAEFLVNRGRQVTILAGQQELAVELAIPSKWILMNSLVESGSPCSPKWNARR